MTAKNKIDIKVVLLGDVSVGKTAAITTFVHETFTKEYTPTIFDTYNKDLSVDGITRKLSIFD
jgi:small GTP-binding protein